MQVAKKIILVLFEVLLWVGLLLSLLPLVQWWAGLFALLLLGVYFALRFTSLFTSFAFSAVDTSQNPARRMQKLLYGMLFFGFLAHLTCSAYSAIRMAHFTQDAHQEANRVFQELAQESSERSKQSQEKNKTNPKNSKTQPVNE